MEIVEIEDKDTQQTHSVRGTESYLVQTLKSRWFN